jgi:general secretion pathway protein C
LNTKTIIIFGVSVTLLAVTSGWLTNLVIDWSVRVPEDQLPGYDPASPPVEQKPLQSGPKVETPVVRSKRQLIDGIIARNIFDHTTIGVGQSTPGPGDDGEEVTDLKLRLLATMVAEPANFSSALIALDDKNGETNGYGIGDEVTQGAVVVEIEKKKVVLQRDGKREVLLFDEDGVKPRKKVSSSSGGSEDEDGIAETSENKFVIPRETLDKYIGDLDALAKMGRARPHRDDGGSVDGYRLSGIRKNTLGSKLGIKTGDVVHSVNGKPLTSMKEAMDAWQSLQNEGGFNFEITRRGQRQTMEYTVR